MTTWSALETPQRDDIDRTPVAAGPSTESRRLLNPQAVEALLATELQQLTFHDREGIQEEIHGIRSLAPKETPAMVEEALRRLEEEVKKLPHKPAYDRAVMLRSRYVRHDRAFRIKFLRAELYDARKAAVRFVGYLEMLAEHFGEATLMRPLLLDDLRGDDAIHVVKEGKMQLLPTRDRFGRRVMCVVGAFGKGHSRAGRVRASMYINGTALSDDEETQINGMTAIFWLTDELPEISGDPDERKEIVRLCDCLPVRTSAIHICFKGTAPVYQLFKAAILMALPRDVRARTRIHMGPPIECCYQLLTFGIPVHDLPVTDTGRLKTKFLSSWIKTRKAMDAAFTENRAFEGVECPLRQDVLFFNGGHKWSFPGNTAFREILRSTYPTYEQSTSNVQKRAVIQEIISDVTTMDARFLAWNASKGWWDVLPPDSKVLSGRVGVALRDHYKRVKEREKHKQTSKSHTARFTEQGGLRKLHPDGTLGAGYASGCSW